MKSWPPSSRSSNHNNCVDVENLETKSDPRKFWKRLAASWGIFVGRRKEPPEVVSDELFQPPEPEPVTQVGCDCCPPPVYRGINISSASICSLGSPGQEQGSTPDEFTSKFSQFKKMFSPTNSPKLIRRKLQKI